MSFAQMVNRFRNTRWVAEQAPPARTGLKVALVVAVLSIFIPNWFQSEAKILPSDQSQLQLGGLASMAGALGVNLPTAVDPTANFKDILQSRWVRTQLLHKRYHFKQSWWLFGFTSPKDETLEGYIHAKNVDKALIELNDMINIDVDKKSGLITMQVETRSPELSLQIVQASLQLLNQFLSEKGMTRGKQKAQYAEARLTEARQELKKSEEDLQRFLDENRNYPSSAEPIVRLEGQNLEANLQLWRQLVTTLALNRENALLESKNDVPILNILDSGNLPIEKSRPSRLLLVILAYLLGHGGVFAWRHRGRLKALLTQADQ